MSTFRRCPYCSRRLIRKAYETNKQWAVRQHCGAVCGRPRGERARLSRLTPQSVREIRRSSAGARELAERFGVSVGHICNVRALRCWAWLDDEEKATTIGRADR